MNEKDNMKLVRYIKQSLHTTALTEYVKIPCLTLGKESICSTLASEVRADTTQRFKEMKQLPTDTPSHMKALNKLEREAGDYPKGQSHYPIEIELRYRTDMSTGGQSQSKDETTTIAYALLLSEPQTPLNSISG